MSAKYVPFFRIASGSFAFGAPAVLGATDVAGVLMGVELLDSGWAALDPDLLSPRPRDAVALVRSP